MFQELARKHEVTAFPAVVFLPKGKADAIPYGGKLQQKPLSKWLARYV